MKILFVAQNFQLGGITTSLINMLRELSEAPELELAVFAFGDGPYKDRVPSNIQLYQGSRRLRLVATPFKKVLQSHNIIDVLLRVCSMMQVRIMGSDNFYRHLFKKEQKYDGYDICISYFDDMTGGYFNQGTLIYVADFVKADKKIAWSHTDPVSYHFNQEHYKCLLEKFDDFVCVSQAMKTRWQEFLDMPNKNIHVVHNFVQPKWVRQKGEEYSAFHTENVFNIVTVARIDNISKRIDRILKVCRLLLDNHVKDYIWRIVGEGPDMSACLEIIRQEGLENNVQMTGFCVNPYPYMKASQLFVLRLWS